MKCETCGAEIVGRPWYFLWPSATVCSDCFHSKDMTLLKQIGMMRTLGHDLDEDARWPRNMGREKKKPAPRDE